MNNTQTASARTSNTTRQPRARTATRPVALPSSRSEVHELRDLLEANLAALQALHDEHRRMLALGLRVLSTVQDGELQRDLRAMSHPRAPWVEALSETRALLYVALRELIVGSNDAELSRHMARQPTEPQSHR